MRRIIFTVTALTLLVACATQKKETTGGVRGDTIRVDSAEANVSAMCPEASNKDTLAVMAEEIVAAGNNKEIWNLQEIDSSEYFTVEDYFTNAVSKDRLVLFGGSAGISSGSADNLLMLVRCNEQNKPFVLWSGQIGEIKPEDIRDLDNDGIKEIISSSSMTWMGESNESYMIFNFKNRKRNFFYRNNVRSVLDAGNENLSENYSKGDTLEVEVKYQFMDTNNDKVFDLVEQRTIKIHNGGANDEEMMANLKTVTDTAVVKLKIDSSMGRE